MMIIISCYYLLDLPKLYFKHAPTTCWLLLLSLCGACFVLLIPVSLVDNNIKLVIA